MALNLKRNGWLAGVLAVVLGAALFATGEVRAQQPGGEKPAEKLEPVFDPVFTGEQPLPGQAASKPAAAANPAAGAKPATGGAKIGTARNGAGAKKKAGAARRPAKVTPSRPGNNVPNGPNNNGGNNAGNGNAGANPPAAGGEGNDDIYPEPDAKLVERAVAAQNRITKELMKQKGVLGSATSLLEDGEVVIEVFLNGIDRPTIPNAVDGIRVVKEIVGQFRKFQGGTPTRQRRLARPVPIGVSAIAYTDDVCATGTYGCRLRGANGRYYGLSNNHVFALENDGIPGSTDIVQPGPLDDNCPLAIVNENIIGTLISFSEVLTDGTPNLIDSAVIYSNANTIGSTTLPDGYGIPRSTTVDAFLGQRVQKYGRTTGYRIGVVTSINSSVTLTFAGADATFIEQFRVTGIPEDRPFGGPGDSGSLVVDMTSRPVGLLFAGGGFPVVRTICNDIDNVLSYFRVSLNEPTLVIDNGTPTIPPGHVGSANPGVPNSPILPTVP